MGVAGFYFGRIYCENSSCRDSKIIECYEAAGGTQPLPRAGWTEVAGAGGQGHIRATLGVTVSTVPLWRSKLALKPPRELPLEDPP